MHLSFIVDQTEQYSTWLTEGLGVLPPLGAASTVGGTSAPPSVGPSSSVCEDESVANDNDFQPDQSSEDDEGDDRAREEEAEQGEGGAGRRSQRDELDALRNEGEMPLEELPWLDSVGPHPPLHQGLLLATLLQIGHRGAERESSRGSVEGGAGGHETEGPHQATSVRAAAGGGAAEEGGGGGRAAERG